MQFDEPFDRHGTNCWKWDAEGKHAILPMGCADLDFRIMPEIADALKAKIDEGALTYPVDDDGAYQAFADYFERHHGMRIDTSHIRYCFGMMCGYSLLLDALTVPGDEVVVQTPVFDYFMDTAENAGRKIVDSPFVRDEKTGAYRIDFADLERALARPRAKMMLICNPMNPTGMAFTADDLVRVFELCVKHDVLLMSDEVHSEFFWHGKRFVSLLEVAPAVSDRFVVMTAPSKTFNIHGLYTALFIMPNESIRQAYTTEFSRRHMDFCDLGMVAMKAAYTYGDEYVSRLHDYIEGNLTYVEDLLRERDFGVRMAPMDATYLIWLDFRAWGKTSVEVDEILRSYGLVISKGSNYGPGGEGFMRMDIATQRANVVRAFELIEQAWREQVASPRR